MCPTMTVSLLRHNSNYGGYIIIIIIIIIIMLTFIMRLLLQNRNRGAVQNTNSGRRNILNVKSHVKKIGFELVLKNSTV